MWQYELGLETELECEAIRTPSVVASLEQEALETELAKEGGPAFSFLLLHLHFLPFFSSFLASRCSPVVVWEDFALSARHHFVIGLTVVLLPSDITTGRPGWPQ